MKPADLFSCRERQSLVPARPILYKPHDIAKMLGCSEWWVKEQARSRRIPFSWIGGSYRFTDSHVTEIIRFFEVRPTGGDPTTARTSSPRRARMPTTAEPGTRLRARPPRRALRNAPQPSIAA